MKLVFVEISGFRGFKDKTRFDLPGGFVVLTGRNGVGKSTVLDAVDFALTGTINKYPVTEARGGGLDDHIWWVGEGVSKNSYVSIGFGDSNGEEFVITRSRERGLEISASDIIQRLCVGDSPPTNCLEILMQTTLIRDEKIAALSLDLPEQARAAAVRAAIGGLAGPDHTKRTTALLETAKNLKTAQDSLVTGAQAELSRALGTLTEARSLAGRQTDVSEAEDLIKTLLPSIKGAPEQRSEMLRRIIANRKQSISALGEAIALAEGVQSELIHFESNAGQTEIAVAHAEVEAALQARDQANAAVTNAERIEAIERENDVFASHMVALLDHGEIVGLQQGHCPLCDAARSTDSFSAAIASARANLRERGIRATHSALSTEQARMALQQAEVTLISAQQRLTDLESRRTVLSQNLKNVAEIYGQWALDASPLEPEAARRRLLQRQEETARLEHSLFVLEASSAHDRVVALEARIQQIRTHLDEELAKLTGAERALDATRQIDNAAREVANQVVTEQFDTVMPLLKELYQRLRPHADWRDIEIDFGGRVRASLNFTVGDGRNPQFLFSSGQRRAAGIAFLLAIHLSRPWCRLRSLLLDDPVQHIDDYRSLNLVEVLSAVRRTGRQVVVAVEDSALADLLCRRLRSTTGEAGRRFELTTGNNGSASIENQMEIPPLPRHTLREA